MEVKTTLRSEDVTHFLEKLARFTEYEPVWKGKNIFGAVAYLKTDASVQAYAERQGLFVIRATGNSASIINRDRFPAQGVPLTGNSAHIGRCSLRCCYLSAMSRDQIEPR